MYKVLVGFIDGVEKRSYKKGDDFVVGPKTDKTRIQSLMSADNNLQQPLIEYVQPKPELKSKQEVKGE